jgi:integrase
MSTKNASSPPRRVRIERGIYQRPDGVLEIGWKDAEGIQRWRRPKGSGLKAARHELAEAIAKRGRGEKVAADPRLRFSDAADKWWTARVVKLRPATQSAYGASLVHLRKMFGKRRLTDLTPDDVATYVSNRQAAEAKGWTIKGEMTVLSSIFKYSGRHLGFVGANPVSMLDRVERPNSDDEAPKRILTHEELSKLLSKIEDEYRPLFSLVAETGCRLSEVLGLVWHEVDFEAQAISFSHQLSRQGKRVPLKTKRSARTIEVTPDLIATLRKVRLVSEKSGDHDFVFVSRARTAHDQRNIGGRVLARAVKRAGLEAIERDGEVVVPAPTMHDLRHSHASALIAQGWDIAEASARLGHSSVQTTLRVYAHEFDKANRSENRRSRLASLYGSRVEAGVEASEAKQSPDRKSPTSPMSADNRPNAPHLRAVGD